jgi:hypothetical protein
MSSTIKKSECFGVLENKRQAIRVMANDVGTAWSMAQDKLTPEERSTLKYIGSVPQPYTTTYKSLSSTNNEPPTSQCCGGLKSKPQGSYRVSYEGQEKQPTTRTPLVPHDPIQMDYKFSWKTFNERYTRQIYLQVREFYLREMADTTNNPVGTTKYIRLRYSLNKLNAMWQNRQFIELHNTFAPQYPPRYTTKKGVLATLSNPTESYEETISYKRKYITYWKCEQDSTNPCCGACLCQRTCSDFTNCEENEDCVGHPECGYSPLGCCEDNCANKCGSGQPCTEPGETCKNGCCWEGDCRYGEWTPNPNTICNGQSFVQTRSLKRGPIEMCDITQIKSGTGTKNCTSPSPAGIILQDFQDMIFDLI